MFNNYYEHSDLNALKLSGKCIYALKTLKKCPFKKRINKFKSLLKDEIIYFALHCIKKKLNNKLVKN